MGNNLRPYTQEYILLRDRPTVEEGENIGSFILEADLDAEAWR